MSVLPSMSVDASVHLLRRARTCAILGVIAPAVAVEIQVGIVDAARRIVGAIGVALLILRLPRIGDTVVVGEDLAEIQLAELAVVVKRRVVGLGLVRVKLDDLEDLAD